jgi:hypothetical protein
MHACRRYSAAARIVAFLLTTRSLSISSPWTVAFTSPRFGTPLFEVYNHEYGEKSAVRIRISSVGPRTSDRSWLCMRRSDLSKLRLPGGVLGPFRTSSAPEGTEGHESCCNELAIPKNGASKADSYQLIAVSFFVFKLWLAAHPDEWETVLGDLLGSLLRQRHLPWTRKKTDQVSHLVFA